MVDRADGEAKSSQESQKAGSRQCGTQERSVREGPVNGLPGSIEQERASAQENSQLDGNSLYPL